MGELKYNLTAKQTKAAYELSDEIYSLLHDAELSGRLLSELVNILGDGDDLDLTHPELLACTISEAAWRLNILVDYAARMRDGLRDLDAAARERALIRSAEIGGAIRSKDLLAILQAMNGENANSVPEEKKTNEQM